MKQILIFFLIVLPSFSIAQNHSIELLDELTSEEITFLQRIESIHDDINFSQSVTRYFSVNGSDTTLVKSSLNYTKDLDGLYFGACIYYSVEILPNNLEIHYSYSAGRAFSAEGSIFYRGGKMIRDDYSYGTGAGTLSIWVENKKIFEELIPFNK